MMLRAALLLGIALVPQVAAAQAAPAGAIKPLAYTERRLPNGLRVYAVRDTGTATVSVQVWYNVGSKDDPRGRSGFAHMFEHLMFKATRNLVPEQFDRLTEDVGGFNNASTNDDYTNYYETVPANHLQRLLFAEADRMASLVVDPATFASERDVVKEELRQRILAQPYGKLFGLYGSEISYSVHPYARPGIGSLEDLQSASIEDVRAFHATYYRPDNAVLVVAGNFDPAQLDRWVDQYFGPIKAPTTPIPRVTVKEPPRTAPISRTVYEANVPLPAVVKTWHIPADREPDSAALAVLNAVLATGNSSRLYESLVYRDQVAAQAGSFLDSKQDTGLLAVYAIVAGGKPVDGAEAGLAAQIARLREAPVSAAELAKARNQLLTEALRERETADGKAGAIARGVIIDGDPAASDKQLAAIAAVTPADVQRVAQRYLGEAQAATLRYLPKAADSPAGDTIAVAPTVVTAPLAIPANIAVVTPASAAERLQPPPPAAPVQAAIPVPNEVRLANGLRVVTIERHDLPLVAAALAVPGGSATDGGKAGLADLTAELVTKGTATRTAPQVAQAVEALGGSLDSDSDFDGSGLTLSVKADQLDAAMTVMADVARNPAFAADEVERARAQAIDAAQVALKNPAQLANLVAARAVFGASGYGGAPGGTLASLKAIGRTDITGLYGAQWRPDGATLILTGDITAARARALAEKHFGGWRARPGAVPAPPTAPALPRRVIVVDLPGAGQAAVVVARPALARRDPRYFAAATANAVLGTGFSSRLNQEIRIKRGLSYGAGSRLSARRGVGPLAAVTQTKNPSAPEVVGLIVAEMARLGSEPVPAAELGPRKEVLIGDFGRRVETVSGLANVAASYAIEEVPLVELGRYTARVAGVDAAAVKAAAGLLDPNGATIVVVGDAKQFVDELRKTYPALELIPAAQLNLDTPTLK